MGADADTSNVVSTKSSIQEITSLDMKDPTLFKLNQVLQLLAAQIAAVQGQTGTVTFQGDVVAPNLEVRDSTTLSLHTYANNAAALAAGETEGTLYRTATGQVYIVYEP